MLFFFAFMNLIMRSGILNFQDSTTFARFQYLHTTTHTENKRHASMPRMGSNLQSQQPSDRRQYSTLCLCDWPCMRSEFVLKVMDGNVMIPFIYALYIYIYESRICLIACSERNSICLFAAYCHFYSVVIAFEMTVLHSSSSYCWAMALVTGSHHPLPAKFRKHNFKKTRNKVYQTAKEKKLFMERKFSGLS